MMNQEQKAHLAETYALIAEISGRTLSERAIIMLVESLRDLDFVAVTKVLNGWTRTEKGFPHPSDIRAKIMPEIDDKDNSIEVANLILKSIGRHGWNNSTDAKNSMGDLAWEVVERIGGWTHLCESITSQNEGVYRAQIRELAQAVSKRAKRGELNLVPQLPQPSTIGPKHDIAALIAGSMKELD